MSNSHLPIVRPEVFILEGLWSDTADAVRAAGGNPTEGSPWDINDTERELLSGNYHALILTGGSDINPRLYTDQPIHPTVYGVDYTRDEVEIRALEIALELGMPVLGICRGSQIMTAFRGGRLCQNIEGHRGTEHRAYAAPNARTFRRAIGSREMRVVSLHHQCVVDPGPGMRIAALAHDGTPEAVESIDGRWLGCQFHPEINTFSNAIT
jgi:putative glutamine amidotransferase